MVTVPKQNSACMAETAETTIQSPPCAKKSQLANNYGSCCSIAYINHRDLWNKSLEGRKLIRRIDCLITYATLSYFSKYVDQQNVTVSTHDPKL